MTLNKGAVLPLENPLENSPLRKGALRGSRVWLTHSLHPHPRNLLHALSFNNMCFALCEFLQLSFAEGAWQIFQGMFDHDKGQKSAISGRRLHWIFGIFSSRCFSFFSRFYVQFSKEIALKCGENGPISGRTRLWLSWFFRPRITIRCKKKITD